MSQLSELVGKYYPQEKINKDREVTFSTSLNTIFGKSVENFLDSSTLKIPMVETDKMLFFDVRPIFYSYKPWLKRLNPLNILISVFVIVFFIYFFTSLIAGIIRTPSLFGLFMILFLVIGIPLILKQNKTITNIFAIKKDWVSKDSTEKGEREITWSMPENVMSFSFVHLLDERTKNNLPFFLKLQSGMYFKGLYDFWLRKVSFVKFQDVVFTIRE